MDTWFTSGPQVLTKALYFPPSFSSSSCVLPTT